MTQEQVEQKMYEQFELPWLHFGMVKPEIPTIKYSEVLRRSKEYADEMVEMLKVNGGISTADMERQMAEEAGKTPKERIKMQLAESFMKIMFNHYVIEPD